MKNPKSVSLFRSTWLSLLLVACAVAATLAAQDTLVTVDTTLGRFSIELYPQQAPKTVENFLQYVEDGFYNGTTFHRVIPNFMVQGGGMTPALREKETRPAIPNEADNGLENLPGTLAMARTNDPHSAAAQFFINLRHNVALDHRDKSAQGWGYAVFGRVISGMEVVQGIASVPTVTRAGHRHVPVMPVEIRKVWVQK